jgi:phenylacetate-CoA ligase
MSFQFKRNLYESLGPSIRQFVRLIPFEVIAGKAYRQVMRRQSFFDSASRTQVLNYQEQKLKEILSFAVEHVPGYMRYRSAVNKLTPFKALQEFPILSKEGLQSDLDSYLPRDFNKIPHYSISTGGTSGSQLNFFVDDTSQSMDSAFAHRLWSQVNYTPRKRRATFRGVKFPKLGPNTYWQPNPIYNELQFSPFHMNEQTMGPYVEKISSWKPEFIYGLPSAIDMLAEYIVRHDCRHIIPKIQAALIISEGISADQRARIEYAFGTRVYSFYGHSERVIMAGECECNETYHHIPDYGILEMVSEDGTICDQDGQRGELVGTGFHNRSMPLIRYRTGDFAVRCASNCECGRNWDRFRNVEGRWNLNMLAGKNGTKISIAALNMHGTMFNNIVRYQYYQNQPGKFILRVQPSPLFSHEDLEILTKAYRDKVGDQMEFQVQLVEEIPLTKRGKLRLLVTEMSHNQP